MTQYLTKNPQNRWRLQSEDATVDLILECQGDIDWRTPFLGEKYTPLCGTKQVSTIRALGSDTITLLATYPSAPITERDSRIDALYAAARAIGMRFQLRQPGGKTRWCQFDPEVDLNIHHEQWGGRTVTLGLFVVEPPEDPPPPPAEPTDAD
jgi:hypothetical protein